MLGTQSYQDSNFRTIQDPVHPIPRSKLEGPCQCAWRVGVRTQSGATSFMLNENGSSSCITNCDKEAGLAFHVWGKAKPKVSVSVCHQANTLYFTRFQNPGFV